MSNPIAILAVAGPAGGGKDTCGSYLIEKYGFKKLSFAAPLKQMLAVLGYPEPANADLKEAVISELGVSWRFLAQTLGTEWGRALINPDVWVILAEKLVRTEGGRFVITDCRFENEAALTRRLNGVVCHLSGRAHGMTEGTKAHVSEKGVEHHASDIDIDNSGSLEALHRQLDEAVRYVGVTPIWTPAYGAQAAFSYEAAELRGTADSVKPEAGSET